MRRNCLLRTYGAAIPDEIQGVVTCEAIRCAVQLDVLVVVDLNGNSKTRGEHVFGSNPNWVATLRTWGEAGVVKVVGKDGKTGNRGIEMMHSSDAATVSQIVAECTTQTQFVCSQLEISSG
jgi:hypothetical protein